MANFISRLLARVKGRKQQSRRSNRSRNRQLRVEAMESRRLLAGDLGSITGNVFADLLDTGTLDVGDIDQVGVNVFLYQDGGNGTFESSGGVAAGDDTLIGTDPTDGSGVYLFENLVDATYFVEQAAISGLLQRSIEQVKTVTITDPQSAGVQTQTVDTFDTTGQTLQANSGTPTDSDSAVTAGAESLGGERDILVTHSAGANNVDVAVAAGLLSISTGAGTTGSVVISYDGADADAINLNHATLGPVDLTTSSANAFQFRAGSEAGNTITVDVFSSATDFSSTTVALPVTAGAVANEDMIIRFTDFSTGGGTGADFTSVTAIRMQVDMAAATDAQFDFTQVVAPFVSTQNFPNLNPMSIGDLIFSDPNDNGALDVGETGISGVTVELYEDTNLNGSYDNGTDVAVGVPQVTNGSGNFQFDNLFPGEYIALVPISQFATNSDPLFGFLSSSGNDPAPDPDATDTNSDDNGTLIAGVGVATAAITLAAGTEPTNDGDADTNTNLALDFGFAPQIDLEVTKTSSASTVTAGTQLTYTINVINNGDATANNVTVIDNLPDLAPDALVIDSATSASGNGTVTLTGVSTGEVEVAYTSLTSGESDTITIVVTVPPAAAAAAAITNTVTVSGDGVETNTANNTDNLDVAVDRAATLTITKTDTPDPAAVGATLTYDIVVTNTGPSTATNVVVSDTLPAGLTFSNVTTTLGTASEAGGVITGNIPSLAVSQSATITVTTTINASFTGSTIANSATADSDEATLVTANQDTTVNPQVDLAITKSDSADPIDRGSQLVYTLDVINNGPSTANSVEIVDTLPAGVTFVSATGGTVTPPGGGSTDVTIALAAPLASAGTAQITITVDVDQSAAASISNTAIVRSTESLAGFDSNTANNTVTETTATQASVDLEITKADSVDPIEPGNSYVYTLVVTNNGPSDATGVTVADNLPDGLQITSATSTVGTVTIPASAQDTVSSNPDDLTVDVGALANGATATVTINATVLPDARGTLSNVATVSSTDTSLIETNSANNSATETTTLNPSIDLAVTKNDSIDPAIAGNDLTYTIVVTNNGPSTATGVSLSDTLPAGVTFSSVVASQGTASESGGVVTGTLGDLAPAASATITLVVGVDSATRGTLSNTATVSATETDSNSANDSATATTTINGNVDLSVTKVESTDPVAATGTLTYTMVVTNNGPSTATNVVVSDTLPSDLSFTSGTSTVGSVTNAGNAVTANVGTLAPGASATITIQTSVGAGATGTITNTATVTSSETDTNSANDSATETTDVAVPASIAGTVYVDANQNGVRDAGEDGIAGVAIALSGTDILGATINQSQTTDASGNYSFTNLLPGTYQLTETQPDGLGDGQTSVGTGATGTAGTNEITTITLNSGAAATAFNFGEILSALSKRRLLASSEAGD